MKEVPASSVILHTAAVTFWQRKIRDAFYENRNMHSICRIFEPYPSVQARIEESKRNGARGRIEANPEYSLFKNPQKKTEISVFERAGFTQELLLIISARHCPESWIYGLQGP